MTNCKAWIEAMRLRTLPVSVAGVAAAAGCAAYLHEFHWPQFTICLIFALLAQIASNFANEYFDYKNGLDRPGRDGFRRGVTEGDISPKSMRNATFILLALDSLVGLSLVYWGGWLLIPAGVAIALFALAYSAGPWPLSHHGLGEVAVVIFFGIVPVTCTTWVQNPSPEIFPTTIPIALAIGIMGANVLIVNNYRDINDDRASGKRTLAVRFGRNAMQKLYIVNGFIALLAVEWVMIPRIPLLWQIGPFLYINLHWILWQNLKQSDGKELNPILGKTAMLMFLFSIWIMISMALNPIMTDYP